jgi:putative endonuclease
VVTSTVVRGEPIGAVGTGFYVYILANLRGRRPVLYVGVTNDLERRLSEHQASKDSFVGRYHVDTLVLVETFGDPNAAISREEQIKGWTRAKKVALIRASNPTWRDLRSG